MRLTSVVFGIVHSNRTVVVLLPKHFSSWLGTFCNSIGTVTNCMHANVMAYVNNSFNFSGYLITSNFSSIPIVFCWLFTWIALGEVDLHYSLTWVTKANVVEGRSTAAAWLYHQRNQLKHVIDGVTVTSLSASLQHMTSAVTDHHDKSCYTEKYLVSSMLNCVKPKTVT